MEENKNSTNIEKEFKNLIYVNEYVKTLSYLKLKPLFGVMQCNSFFDNEQLSLHKKNATLRIRFSNGVRELTLKEDADDGRLETNYSPLSDKQFADLIIEGIIPKSDILTRLQHSGVKGPYWYQGEMITNRIEISYKGCKLAIDHAKYLGTEDYEIEVEKDNEKVNHKKVAKNLLENLGIPVRKVKGKRKRFFEFKLRTELV